MLEMEINDSLDAQGVPKKRRNRHLALTKFRRRVLRLLTDGGSMGGVGHPALMENQGGRKPSTSILLAHLGGYPMGDVNDGKPKNTTHLDSNA